MEPVPEKINFAQSEVLISDLWKKLDAFHTSLKQSKGKPKYVFFDGPPFATGLPHYGHILAGTIKDIVTRYAHQSGFHVERRFGWDCHGLPVEYEIDKTLGIKGPEDVAAMGIAEYNKQCRAIVMRYSSDWEKIVGRLGRWIDFKNDYKTLYPWYMESIWWVFKQLFDKGLVYRGFKVMPFSTGCNTPLSNFEANQNYKDTVDPAVIISFPLDEDPNVNMIAWTTTPWTLPSNLGLCVHPEKTYVKVQDKSNSKIYILMEARLISLFKTKDEYTVLEKFNGKSLEGKTYQPLFNYFAHMKSEGAFKVMCDGYVTDDSGTGVVHQAPFFGADDYRVCLENGVFKKDGDSICPVDASGRFTDEITDFKGIYVKDADKQICKHLKEIGRMVHHGTTKHNYPFCWRSDTPLIYKAVPSWFVRVEHMNKELLENNSKTYWVPDFVKEKRFANWLRDAHDWAISRNRYWGTPIPLWVSDDLEEIVCIGSIQELEDLSGVRISDLHRESVDGITIPSKMGKGELRRISEVFDCWFESGSMPYAQSHYPFENKKDFEDNFPANFIAEGIDQTRGWFYTLLVLSTSLFGRPPFKNLIVNGLVLASDGQKMSKRKKNYPDPMNIINEYGADALRLYLINSPVVRAETLRFKADGVRNILKDVFLPWYNAYRFLVQNIIRLEKDDKVTFEYRAADLGSSTNIMDKWILSFTQSLVKFVKQEMAAYRLYTVVPRLVKFVDLLTNWYVRSNRKRLKGETGIEDCKHALQTLFSIIFTMTRLMGPFTPFLTELIYQNLRKMMPEFSDDSKASVHYLMLPDPMDNIIDVNIERAVSRMQSVIDLARVIRERNTLPLKYPLGEVVVIHKNQEYLDDIISLQSYVKEELNIRNITVSADKDKYSVSARAEPDHMVLGKRLKDDFKKVTAEIRKMTPAQVEDYISNGSTTLLNHTLTTGDLRIIFQFTEEKSKYQAHSDNDVLVLLDVTPDQSMIDEGVARELVNRVQKLRKKAKLVPTDQVTVYYNIAAASEYLLSIAEKHSTYISTSIKAPFLKGDCIMGKTIIEESTQLKGQDMKLTIVHGHQEEIKGPVSKFVNVFRRRTGQKASLFLENPRSCATFRTLNDVKLVVQRIFKLATPLPKMRLSLMIPNGERVMVGLSPSYVDDLHGNILIVDEDNEFVGLSNAASLPSNNEIACQFVNVQCTSSGAMGSVLLQNPVDSAVLSTADLSREVQNLFEMKTCQLYTPSKEALKSVSGSSSEILVASES